MIFFFLMNICLLKHLLTSGQGGPWFCAWSRFRNAVCMLSPYLLGFTLLVPPSSHTPGHAAEIRELILPLPFAEEDVASELELLPGRGTVIAHNS